MPPKLWSQAKIKIKEKELCLLIFPCLPICSDAHSCPTLCNLTDHSPPGSSAHGILLATILELCAISFFRESSQPKDRTWVSYGSCTGRWIFFLTIVHLYIPGLQNKAEMWVLMLDTRQTVTKTSNNLKNWSKIKTPLLPSMKKPKPYCKCEMKDRYEQRVKYFTKNNRIALGVFRGLVLGLWWRPVSTDAWVPYIKTLVQPSEPMIKFNITFFSIKSEAMRHCGPPHGKQHEANRNHLGLFPAKAGKECSQSLTSIYGMKD